MHSQFGNSLFFVNYVYSGGLPTTAVGSVGGYFYDFVPSGIIYRLSVEVSARHSGTEELINHHPFIIAINVVGRALFACPAGLGAFVSRYDPFAPMESRVDSNRSVFQFLLQGNGLCIEGFAMPFLERDGV